MLNERRIPSEGYHWDEVLAKQSESTVVPRLLGRVALTIMLIVALAVAWLGYSVSATFENWPWTVRHTYRSGNFEGVTIGSTKADAMEQIQLRQRQGALDSVAFIDDLGVLVAQERAGGSLTADAVQRIGHADHWYLVSLARSVQLMKPGRHMELYFSQHRQLRIV
jgi:hypothetical protein